jgi:mannosyltransferase OCH1-like enzyme
MIAKSTKETIMAITTKKVLKWIWSEFKREMQIQKPGPEYYAARRNSEPTVARRYRFSRGIDAGCGLLLMIVVAPVVFLILVACFG